MWLFQSVFEQVSNNFTTHVHWFAVFLVSCFLCSWFQDINKLQSNPQAAQAMFLCMLYKGMYGSHDMDSKKIKNLNILFQNLLQSLFVSSLVFFPSFSAIRGRFSVFFVILPRGGAFLGTVFTTADVSSSSVWEGINLSLKVLCSDNLNMIGVSTT